MALRACGGRAQPGLPSCAWHPATSLVLCSVVEHPSVRGLLSLGPFTPSQRREGEEGQGQNQCLDLPPLKREGRVKTRTDRPWAIRTGAEGWQSSFAASAASWAANSAAALYDDQRGRWGPLGPRVACPKGKHPSPRTVSASVAQRELMRWAAVKGELPDRNSGTKVPRQFPEGTELTPVPPSPGPRPKSCHLPPKQVDQPPLAVAVCQPAAHIVVLEHQHRRQHRHGGARPQHGVLALQGGCPRVQPGAQHTA